jgi:hypothetical protein
MWDLWLTEWHWDRFLSECFSFPYPLSFRQYSSISDARNHWDSEVTICGQQRVTLFTRLFILFIL